MKHETKNMKKTWKGIQLSQEKAESWTPLEDKIQLYDLEEDS